MISRIDDTRSIGNGGVNVSLMFLCDAVHPPLPLHFSFVAKGN